MHRVIFESGAEKEQVYYAIITTLGHHTIKFHQKETYHTSQQSYGKTEAGKYRYLALLLFDGRESTIQSRAGLTNKASTPKDNQMQK